MLHYPMGKQTNSDAHYLSYKLGEIMDELDKRGYDKTTLKFSIEPQAGNERFCSQKEYCEEHGHKE